MSSRSQERGASPVPGCRVMMRIFGSVGRELRSDVVYWKGADMMLATTDEIVVVFHVTAEGGLSPLSPQFERSL